MFIILKIVSGPLHLVLNTLLINLSILYISSKYFGERLPTKDKMSIFGASSLYSILKECYSFHFST